MALVSSTATLSSILLEDVANATTMCLDVIPARWDARVGMDDAVLTMVALLLGDAPAWHTGDPVRYGEVGYTNEDVHVAPGGMIYHVGTPLDAQAQTPRIVLDARGIVHLPDGRSYGWQEFAAINEHDCTPQADVQRRVVLTYAKGHHTHRQPAALSAAVMAFTLGAMEAFVDSPANGKPGHMSRLFLTHTFMALAGRSLRHLACVDRSGSNAVLWLKDNAQAPIEMVLRSWALRPNRGWAPDLFSLGAFHAEAVAACVDTLALEAGRRAGRIFFGQGATFDALLPSEQEHVFTAHQKLARTALQKDVEKASLMAYAAAPHLLKPQAAKKAQAWAAQEQPAAQAA